MAVTFYFTRHGETQFNVENRVQGWCDSPLTEKGVRDARLLGRGLADRDFAAAYASDASRARDTLALALEARAEARACEGRAIAPVPVREDARLREWCFGALEGEPSEAMRQCLRDLFGEDLPREAQNRRLNEIADYLNATDPMERAENFAAIAARIEAFLHECGRAVEEAGGGNVLVVSHALLIRALVFLYVRDGVPFPSKIENASITEVVWDDGAISVGAIGATDHLAG
ncbi:MAG: histidine phosphatase family protein [Enterorhabdus sp.]|jgi:broad specificity phosphatase PhoE|nr:histidine phosphatase family protein [Enterorhabdus sp.]